MTEQQQRCGHAGWADYTVSCPRCGLSSVTDAAPPPGRAESHPLIGYKDYVWDRGGLRQRDLTPRVVYDRAYLETRYKDIDANVRALSAKRLRVLEAFAPDAERGPWLLDYGCGTGRFVEAATESGWDAYGTDLVSFGVEDFLPAEVALRRTHWDVVTFFDSLEHLPNPAAAIRRLAPKWLMISIPECHYPGREGWFMRWKHRRPGEHLWHWSRDGLDFFMGRLGYRPLMHSNFEDEFRPYPEQSKPNILTAVYRAKSGQTFVDRQAAV